MSSLVKQLRTTLGAVVLDLPRFLRCAFLSPGRPRSPGWAWNRNRDDQIVPGPNGEGIVCQWEFTRSLHVTKMFPIVSGLLLRRMLSDYPIQLLEQPVPAASEGGPVVSFVIGHRGSVRLPHLLLTLKSIAGQNGIPIECIVVEQSNEQQILQHLPTWVRYHHIRTPSPDYLYNRSWALNEGCKLARGRILVLHDGDMLVPADYALEMQYQIDAGFDVANLKRFIAYLDESSSKVVFSSQRVNGPLRSEEMIQNLCAGGSIGVTKDAYFGIGAMDEEFVGWGGEDTEFWDRCQTLRVANHTYMPIVHLWHSSQPGKAAVKGLGASTADLFTRRMKIPTADRIAQLRQHLTEPRVNCYSIKTDGFV